MVNPLSKDVQINSGALAVGIEEDVLSHGSAQQFGWIPRSAKANVGTPGHRRLRKLF